MAGAGGIDAQQQLDALDVLGGDLRQRLLGHRDLIGGGVRAGVAGAQLAGQRLTGLIGVGQHRVKAVAALEGRPAPSFSEWLPISVASRSIVKRSGAPASFHTRARAAACAARSHSIASGSLAIWSITRNAVESDATAPNKSALIAEHGHVGQAVAAVGEHHRQIANHAPAVVTTRAQLHGPNSHDSARVSPVLSATCGQQRAAGMRHQARSVRRHFYGYLAPIVRHLQGDPPELAFALQQPEESLLRRTAQAAPDHRGRNCFMHDPG